MCGLALSGATRNFVTRRSPGARGCHPPQHEWKYVNVRRPLVEVEESVDQGTQWAVFEPNEEPI